jgi:hypothetical protein
MQSLIALLTQLTSKAWLVIVVTIVSGSAAAVYYFSSANTGSTLTAGKQLVLGVQTGPVTLPNKNHSSPLPVVPEANAGLVLIPVVAAMLLFSSRRLWSAKSL